MRKTALGCTILEGHDVADLPLVSQNAEILETELAKKVSTVAGKGLSTNDYTTAEKNKLKGIATGANNYTHPAGTNPHGTTKADVGLNSVSNYGVATKAEAEAGSSNAKYMTPLRTKEAIAKLSSGGIEEFGSNSNGTFIKFMDGTLIMRMENVKLSYFSKEALSTEVTFPVSLSSTLSKVYSSMVTPDPNAMIVHGSMNLGVARLSKIFNDTVMLFGGHGFEFKSTDTANVNITIIGRWK